MAYLEKLLPKFRKGTRIRRLDWSPESYIEYKKNKIWTRLGNPYLLTNQDIASDRWELYVEKINWNKVIEDGCLCWFWDTEDHKYISKLYSISDNHMFMDINRLTARYCEPVTSADIILYHKD